MFKNEIYYRYELYNNKDKEWQGLFYIVDPDEKIYEEIKEIKNEIGPLHPSGNKDGLSNLETYCFNLHNGRYAFTRKALMEFGYALIKLENLAKKYPKSVRVRELINPKVLWTGDSKLQIIFDDI